MSLIDESLLEDEFEKKMNGLYPVERGLSCFADEETFAKYEEEVDSFYNQNEQGNYYSDVWEKLIDVNTISTLNLQGEYINYTPANSTGNMIVFSSGYGDGLYPRYVGFDKDRNVIKMITDFIQIVYDNEPTQ